MKLAELQCWTGHTRDENWLQLNISAQEQSLGRAPSSPFAHQVLGQSRAHAAPAGLRCIMRGRVSLQSAEPELSCTLNWGPKVTDNVWAITWL